MIEINNLTTNPIDEKFLEKIANKVLESENKKKADLSIAFVGQGRMRELNKKYRGKNRVTDVLAFGQNQKSKRPNHPKPTKNQKFPILPKDELGLGEIVICLSEVKKNAKRFDITFKTELARILIHGILHLLGYDHEKGKKRAEIMEGEQNYYLSRIYAN